MKTTVIPAQITTVEDRITGNLGLSQIVLLSTPIFVGSALYVILPPFFHSVAYKLILIFTLFLVCSLLSIRIKDKILLLWLVMLLRYNARPRFYLYDKRSAHGREFYESTPELSERDDEAPPAATMRKTLPLSTANLIALQKLIDNPAAKLRFETTKKGSLHVRVTEVK